jgi:hypothetical protein
MQTTSTQPTYNNTTTNYIILKSLQPISHNQKWINHVFPPCQLTSMFFMFYKWLTTTKYYISICTHSTIDVASFTHMNNFRLAWCGQTSLSMKQYEPQFSTLLHSDLRLQIHGSFLAEHDFLCFSIDLVSLLCFTYALCTHL